MLCNLYTVYVRCMCVCLQTTAPCGSVSKGRGGEMPLGIYTRSICFDSGGEGGKRGKVPYVSAHLGLHSYLPTAAMVVCVNIAHSTKKHPSHSLIHIRIANPPLPPSPYPPTHAWTFNLLLLRTSPVGNQLRDQQHKEERTALLSLLASYSRRVFFVVPFQLYILYIIYIVLCQTLTYTYTTVKA